MTAQELMKRPYRMVFTPDPLEGGFTVSFPELPGCLTVGETIEAAAKNAEDAKREWFAAALEDGYPIPEPEPLALAL